MSPAGTGGSGDDEYGDGVCEHGRNDLNGSLT